MSIVVIRVMKYVIMKFSMDDDEHLFVVMTQDDTGHSCFSNSPLPGLSIGRCYMSLK